MADQLSSCSASSQGVVRRRSLLEDRMSNLVLCRDKDVPENSTAAMVVTPREEIITKTERHSGDKYVIPKNDDQGIDTPQSLSHDLDDTIYQPLPAGHYTRRLILEPREEEDAPLIGRLEVFDLSQVGSGDSFEAISYAWGSDIKDQIVTINGRPMRITTSLRDSLRQTRRPDRPRVLWADAICINQDDNREKGHQVSLMGRIYKTSRCTLVCFGYSATKSWPRQVTTLIADVGAMIDRVLAGDDPELKVDPKLGVFPRLKYGDPLLADERWHAWGELVTHPWFERGWVVQEAALGPECLLLWSGVEISFISVLRVAIWAIRDRHRIEALRDGKGWGRISPLYLTRYVVRRPQELNILRKIRSTTTTISTLLENMDAARTLKLKDPKDRIYAFMALPTSDASMPALHVSYGEDISHLDVYRDFATRYLAKNSNLDILEFVEHGDDEALATAPLGQVCPANNFPSWMPRWDCGPRTITSRLGRTFKWRKIDLESKESVEILNNNSILRVKAIIFDSVDYVSMVIPQLTYGQPAQEAVEPVVLLWRAIAEQPIHPGGPHQSCSGFAEAFLVALCLGQGDLLETMDIDRQGAARVLKGFAKLLEADWSQHYLSMDTLKKDDFARIMAFTGLSWSNRSRFLVLGRGYYAVSSVATRAGDLCAIISGTRMPFILREVAGQKDHYVLVGTAYVQSTVLTDEGLPGRMGESERCDDWKEWNLPTRDIFLC